MNINVSKMAILISFVYVFSLAASYSVQGSPGMRANGKIAFTSDRDGNAEIYLMNADGSGQTRLTNGPASNDYPIWSPDGTKIAFLRQDGGSFTIKQMNPDGTNERDITAVTSLGIFWGMSWSPDGAKIAFQDSTDIFTITMDGSKRVNLTNGTFIK